MIKLTLLGSCGRWRRSAGGESKRVGNVLERCYGSRCFRVNRPFVSILSVSNAKKCAKEIYESTGTFVEFRSAVRSRRCVRGRRQCEYRYLEAGRGQIQDRCGSPK